MKGPQCKPCKYIDLRSWIDRGGRCGTVIYQKNTQTSNYLQSSAHNVMSAINIHISSGVSQPCSQNYQNLFSIISTHFQTRSLKRLRFCSKSGNDFQKIQQRFLFTVLKPFPASKMDSKNSQHRIFWVLVDRILAVFCPQAISRPR